MLAVNSVGDQPPLYTDVATFGAAASLCAQYLRKGRPVGVVGRLVLREWVGDDGIKRSTYSVIGNVKFLGSPRTAEDIEAYEAIAAVREAFHSAKNVEPDIPF